VGRRYLVFTSSFATRTTSALDSVVSVTLRRFLLLPFCDVASPYQEQIDVAVQYITLKFFFSRHVLLGNPQACWWQPARLRAKRSRVGVWQGRRSCWVPQSCGELSNPSGTFPVAGAAPSTSACSAFSMRDRYHVCTGLRRTSASCGDSFVSRLQLGWNKSLQLLILRFYGSPGRDGRRDSAFLLTLLIICCRRKMMVKGK